MARRPPTEVPFLVGTILATLAVAWLSSVFAWGWISAALLAVGMYAVLGGYAYVTRDGFLARLLVFGLVAGLVELAADCWLVDATRTLVYPSAEPSLACSPAYMPFAWAVVLTQVGYLGWLISRAGRMAKAVTWTFGIGVVFIPLFEHFAAGAGWWFYRDVPMVWNTPYYIILAEGLICMTLPVAFAAEAHTDVRRAVGLGLGQGLWIWAAYVLAFSLLG